MKLRVRRTRYRRISSRQSSAYSLFSNAASDRTAHWWRRLNSFSPISRSKLLRADAEVLVFGDEQAELVGQVEVGLVVRRGRQQDTLAVVLSNVLLDGAIALAFAVAEVVAFVDQDEPVAAEFGSSFGAMLIDSDLGRAGGTGRGSPPTSGPGSSGRGSSVSRP